MLDQPSEKSPAWQGKIACQYMSMTLRLDKSQMPTTVNSFIYGHVVSGQALVNYEDKPVSLAVGDMIIFPPLSHPRPMSVSDDFRAICLVMSSEFASESHDTNNLLHTLMLTLNRPESPAIHLNPLEHQVLVDLLKLLMSHINHPHAYTHDALQALYSLYLADLMAIMSGKDMKPMTNMRSYNIFIKFNDLLLENFRQNHEIGFYADRLGISTRYLSMVTKQMTRDTVSTFINKKLLYEACWLLRTTDKSIAEISQELHFSDQASFSKFFKRMHGTNPLQYRKGN